MPLTVVHCLPGMQADLEDATSFLAPIQGCRYVIHTASPVVMNPPKGKVRMLTHCQSSNISRVTVLSRVVKSAEHPVLAQGVLLIYVRSWKP